MVTQVNPCWHCSGETIFIQTDCSVNIGGWTIEVWCCGYGWSNWDGGKVCGETANICGQQDQCRNLPVPIELEPTSIERDVFPRIVDYEMLYAMVLPGFWMDIGQPRDYIIGLRLYLESVRNRSAARLASGAHVVGNVLVHESQDRRRVPDWSWCCYWTRMCCGGWCEAFQMYADRSVRIKKHACISNSIIGWHYTVGRWARIENVSWEMMSM